MKLPTIHLGGTPATRLLEGYLSAKNALDAAIEAVKRAAPNARDYVAPGHDFMGHRCGMGVPCPVHRGAKGDAQVAQDEHADRLEVLAIMRNNMDALAQHVSDRIDEATAQRASAIDSGPGGSALPPHDERDQT